VTRVIERSSDFLILVNKQGLDDFKEKSPGPQFQTSSHDGNSLTKAESTSGRGKKDSRETSCNITGKKK